MHFDDNFPDIHSVARKRALGGSINAPMETGTFAER